MKEKESDKVTINKWGIVRDKKVEIIIGVV